MIVLENASSNLVRVRGGRVCSREGCSVSVCSLKSFLSNTTMGAQEPAPLVSVKVCGRPSEGELCLCEYEGGTFLHRLLFLNSSVNVSLRPVSCSRRSKSLRPLCGLLNLRTRLCLHVVSFSLIMPHIASSLLSEVCVLNCLSLFFAGVCHRFLISCENK